jgi:hypothetical protein
MNEEKKKGGGIFLFLIGVIGMIIFAVVPIWLESFSNNNTQQTQKTFYGYDCKGDCSGHVAGYNWASNKNVSDFSECGGNSNSFIEGCYAYVQGQINRDNRF